MDNPKDSVSGAAGSKATAAQPAHKANTATYNAPFRTIRCAVFDSLKKSELVDQEHAARLQYKLLANEAVLGAKVEFDSQRITMFYNPSGYDGRGKKANLQELIRLLDEEGIRVSNSNIEDRSIDYYREVYCHYNPRSIREHPPYGYTNEEWQGMKGKYEESMVRGEIDKQQKFKEWQAYYLQEHPELVDPTTAVLMQPPQKQPQPPQRKSLLQWLLDLGK